MRSLKRLYRRGRADRWAALFGQVAVYSFVVTAITGVFLLFYYQPSMAPVTYHGSYRLLDGVPMSQAYRSTLNLSFDVRAGLLMRQIHNWASLLFVAAVCLHLMRLFFTGAFRRPRWLNWGIWVTLLTLGMLAGFSGEILPDDMMSGGSLSNLEGVTLSIPVVGTHLMLWIFGGSFPGDAIIPRAYWLHVAVLPALIVALLAVLARRARAAITPAAVAVFWFTCAALALLGTFAEINPVWLYGPWQPGSISAGAVPGWYMGFLDGALRIMPAWEISVAGHPLSLAVLVPAVIMPAAFFTVLAVYPLLESKLTGDRAVHRFLDRPREAATRTAIGAAGISCYGLLWAAAANDEIADHLQLSLYAVTWFFRVAVLAGPVLAFVVTQRLCLGLTRREREAAEHGRETGRIVMDPAGGYHEIREPAHPPRQELVLAEGEQGLAQAGQVLRGDVDVGADAQQGSGHVAGGPGDRAGGGDDAVLADQPGPDRRDVLAVSGAQGGDRGPGAGGPGYRPAGQVRERLPGLPAHGGQPVPHPGRAGRGELADRGAHPDPGRHVGLAGHDQPERAGLGGHLAGLQFGGADAQPVPPGSRSRRAGPRRGDR